MHVLIAEDDPDIAALVAWYLQKAGFSLEVMSNGREVLSVLCTRRPDLLILDLMLPEVDGLQICRAVRSSTGLASLPIVMLTARSDEFNRASALELGVDDYITKPFSPADLVSRVRRLLGT
jgi:two-component system alkaline phosphatase synthesis response regulator PhoP